MLSYSAYIIPKQKNKYNRFPIEGAPIPPTTPTQMSTYTQQQLLWWLNTRCTYYDIMNEQKLHITVHCRTYYTATLELEPMYRCFAQSKFVK